MGNSPLIGFRNKLMCSNEVKLPSEAEIVPEILGTPVESWDLHKTHEISVKLQKYYGMSA